MATGSVPPVSAEGILPHDAAQAAADPFDAASRRWVDELAGDGPEHDDAVLRLHALLLRAARYEVGRRRRALPYLRGDDYDDLAQQSADDALVAVLAKLGTFRGDSRFTTWVYKFALYEAAVKLRRRAWQDRELTLQPDAWPTFASAAPSPGARL
jgi:RNA polymerase sigma-70 factor (ECF subfamily)